MVGVTEMPGIDDYGPAETFLDRRRDHHPALGGGPRDTPSLVLGAAARQRRLPGHPKGARTCSGVSQPTWYFSHVFEHFTR